MSATAILFALFCSFLLHNLIEVRKARQEIIRVLWCEGDWMTLSDLVGRCEEMRVQHHNIFFLLHPLVKKGVVKIEEFDAVTNLDDGEPKTREETRVKLNRRKLRRQTTRQHSFPRSWWRRVETKDSLEIDCFLFVNEKQKEKYQKETNFDYYAEQNTYQKNWQNSYYHKSRQHYL